MKAFRYVLTVAILLGFSPLVRAKLPAENCGEQALVVQILQSQVVAASGGRGTIGSEDPELLSASRAAAERYLKNHERQLSECQVKEIVHLLHQAEAVENSVTTN
jgi:hypothetical protein